MADQGMNIEVIFRQTFEIDDSVEIVPLMEAAILVVASKHPQELIKRRKRIIKRLKFETGADSDSEDDEINVSETTTAQKTVCTSSKIDEERPKQQHHDIKNIPARRKNDKKIVSTNKVNERKAMELKLEASSKIDEERPKQQRDIIKDPARRKSDEKIVSRTKKGDQKKAMEVKLEASKRKLQDGYSKNQQERTNKRIKVLDLKDIPAPQMKRIQALDVKHIPTPQKKNSCPRSRISKKLSRPRTQLMRPLAY